MLTAQQIISSLVESKKLGKVDDTLALFYKEVIEQTLWGYPELLSHQPSLHDLQSEIMLRVLGKFRTALRKKQMKIRGYNPTQIIKFLRGQVTFAVLEYRQSVYDRKTKEVKKKEVDLVYVATTAELDYTLYN
jgi:hypothetical protein